MINNGTLMTSRGQLRQRRVVSDDSWITTLVGQVQDTCSAGQTHNKTSASPTSIERNCKISNRHVGAGRMAAELHKLFF